MGFLRKIFGKIGAAFRWPLAYAGAEWNRMGTREKRLISALAGVVGVLVIGVAGYLIIDSLQELSTSNTDTREALAAIARHRGEYLEAKGRMAALEARIGAEAPQLAADLEAAAKEAGIQIPETVDRPPAPAGKRYMEHSLDVRLRKVGLKELAIFLSKVETNPRLIAITRLQIRRTFGENATLDVDLTATAFERIKEDKRKKPGAAVPTKGKG